MELVKIRHGVFETNSSSTHSLQLTRGTADDAKREIIERLAYEHPGHSTSKLENGILTLEGLECYSGRECKNIYTIIETWEKKLQFLAGFLYGLSSQLADYPKNIEYPDNAFNKTSAHDILINKAFEICSNKNIVLNEVIIDVQEYEYADYIQGFEDFSNKYNITSEQIQEFVDTVMQDDYVITFKDEAYSPYEGFDIIIL